MGGCRFGLWKKRVQVDWMNKMPLCIPMLSVHDESDMKLLSGCDAFHPRWTGCPSGYADLPPFAGWPEGGCLRPGFRAKKPSDSQ